MVVIIYRCPYLSQSLQLFDIVSNLAQYPMKQWHGYVIISQYFCVCINWYVLTSYRTVSGIIINILMTLHSSIELIKDLHFISSYWVMRITKITRHLRYSFFPEIHLCIHTYSPQWGQYSLRSSPGQRGRYLPPSKAGCCIHRCHYHIGYLQQK